MRDSSEGSVKGARKTPRYYVDFALSITGGLSFLFGVVLTQEIHATDSSPIDWKIAIGCFLLMCFGVVVSRRRLAVLAASVGCPSAFLFLKFFSSHDFGALWRGAIFLALSMAITVFGALFGYWREQ
jgi:hypothetical protein